MQISDTLVCQTGHKSVKIQSKRQPSKAYNALQK